MESKDLTDFLFRGLMFEAEAEGFRRAGIQIGASSTKDAESLMEEALAPYNITRRNNALEMARLYAVLFCFENEIRDFIRDALEEKEGACERDFRGLDIGGGFGRWSSARSLVGGIRTVPD